MLGNRFAIMAAALLAVVSAFPQVGRRDGGFTGHATFNDFDAQGNVNCKEEQFEAAGKRNQIDYQNIFGAAAGDLSSMLSGGLCNYTPQDFAHDMSVWYLL